MFFFFKQQTAYEMRISDWSSDVCSSDLWLADHWFNTARIGVLWVGVTPDAPDAIDHAYLEHWNRVIKLLAARHVWMLFDFHQDMQIGRASCRARVCKYE